MIIKGNFVYLKSISINDSNFIYNLRKKKKISKYLNSPPNSVYDQIQWIKNNIKKKDTLDFVIICKKKNKRIGTICFDRIKKTKAEWGRWICLGTSIQNIEAAIILIKFGFEELGFKEIYSLTNINNRKVVNFHKNTNAKYNGIIKSFFLIKNKKTDAVNYTFTKKKFFEFKKKFYLISESTL